MNTNCQNSVKISPKVTKELRNQDDSYQIRTPIQSKEVRLKCPNCQEHSHPIYYACCFQVACQRCFTSAHFLQCSRQFNKFSVSLVSNHTDEESRTRRNGKKSRFIEKCRRCDEPTETFQFCQQCKVNFCLNCSLQIHSKGKFSQHRRTTSLQMEKKKNSQILLTQNCEMQDNAMRKSKKENMENFEYGYKAKQKLTKVMSTPNKKGRSMAKVPFQNQDNNTAEKDKSRKMNSSNNGGFANGTGNSVMGSVMTEEPSFHQCQNHGKTRNILTENYDIVCADCFDQIKSTTSKIRTIELLSWLNNENRVKQLANIAREVVKELTVRGGQIKMDFDKYRHQMSAQYKRKQEMLEERYNLNLMSLEKWDRLAKENILTIMKKCQQIITFQQEKNSQKHDEFSQNKNEAKVEMEKVQSIRYLLTYEEINKLKKEFNQQQDQYQYRINEISPQYFEEVLKNFNFVRRRTDAQGQMNNPQKSLSKMSQSNQLRQSRISNSSITTDRKLKRDDSLIKSNYYELSNNNNLMKRSMSKEIKEDISQRILFPNSRSDKKDKVNSNNLDSKTYNVRNSQYFFDNAQEKNQKMSIIQKRENNGVITSIPFKEVKYINLENFITEKLEKNVFEQLKRDGVSPAPTYIDDKQKSYINDLQISTELLDGRDFKNKHPSISDSRLTYSINIGQSLSSKTAITTPDQATTSASSVNSSMYGTKNKRKSDYMEMRDRMRKPNVIHKITK